LSQPFSGSGGERGAAAPQRLDKAAPTRIGKAGVTVALPRGWYAGTPADGNVIDPLTRVVASSAPIRLSQVPCQIARYSPPAADVSLAVVEWEPSDYARPRPRPGRFTEEAFQPRPAGIECFDGPGGTVQFAEHGRVFGAYLFVGARAPQRLIEQALDVLDRLEVERAAAGTRRLSRNGVSIAVRAGWNGRILFLDAAGALGVIFQVANFRRARRGRGARHTRPRTCRPRPAPARRGG
jgi:hypothetical protein